MVAVIVLLDVSTTETVFAPRFGTYSTVLAACAGSERPFRSAKAWLVAMIKPAEQTWPAAA